MRILLAGEGGQGVQTVAKIIAQVAQKSGKFSSYIPSFGVEQRGGVSLAFIQIDEAPIPYPRFTKAETVVAFCNRAIEKVKPFLKEDTLLIYDNSAITEKFLDPIKNKITKYFAIPAQKTAQEKYSIKALNMIFLGALVQTMRFLNAQDVEAAINEDLKAKIAKNPEIGELNIAALHKGMSFIEVFNQNETPLEGAPEKEIQETFEDEKKKWTRFPEYCKGCSLCIVRCPVKALEFSDDLGFLGNPMPKIDINKCIACELCEKTCPDGAIKLEKK